MFLANDYLPQVSRQSLQSANDRVISGAVHRSPGICLTIDENLGKRQLEDRRSRPVVASNGVPFLQMRSVGLHSTPGRVKEGNKEKTGS